MHPWKELSNSIKNETKLDLYIRMHIYTYVAGTTALTNTGVWQTPEKC